MQIEAPPTDRNTPGRMANAAVTDRVLGLCDEVAFPRELLTRYPHQLSGGQKARVGIARAIAIKPELVELTSALHGLAHDAELRAQYIADAPAFADQFRLPAEQREALIKLDLPAMVKMGAHPLVPFLAQLQIQRLRPRD